MPDHIKSTSFTLMITGFLFIMLTGCNFWNHGKPDAVIEIDLTKPGKILRPDIYGVVIEDINRAAETKGKSETGNLKTALSLVTSMIAIESNADSVKIASNTLALLNLNDLKANQGMIVYSSTQSYKTPSYYALKMFSENRPDKVMPIKVALHSNDATDQKVISDQPDKQNQIVTLKEQFIPSISATAGVHDKSGLVIIKIVNSFNTPKHCRIVLNYKQQIKYKGEVIVMTSGNIMDGNSFKEPEKIVPMTKEVNGLRNTFNYECPANAIVIIHIRYKKGINGFVNCC